MPDYIDDYVVHPHLLFSKTLWRMGNFRMLPANTHTTALMKTIKRKKEKPDPMHSPLKLRETVSTSVDQDSSSPELPKNKKVRQIESVQSSPEHHTKLPGPPNSSPSQPEQQPPLKQRGRKPATKESLATESDNQPNETSQDGYLKKQSLKFDAAAQGDKTIESASQKSVK